MIGLCFALGTVAALVGLVALVVSAVTSGTDTCLIWGALMFLAGVVLFAAAVK